MTFPLNLWHLDPRCLFFIFVAGANVTIFMLAQLCSLTATSKCLKAKEPLKMTHLIQRKLSDGQYIQLSLRFLNRKSTTVKTLFAIFDVAVLLLF